MTFAASQRARKEVPSTLLDASNLSRMKCRKYDIVNVTCADVYPVSSMTSKQIHKDCSMFNDLRANKVYLTAARVFGGVDLLHTIRANCDILRRSAGSSCKLPVRWRTQRHMIDDR